MGDSVSSHRLGRMRLVAAFATDASLTYLGEVFWHHPVVLFFQVIEFAGGDRFGHCRPKKNVCVRWGRGRGGKGVREVGVMSCLRAAAGGDGRGGGGDGRGQAGRVLTNLARWPRRRWR